MKWNFCLKWNSSRKTRPQSSSILSENEIDYDKTDDDLDLDGSCLRGGKKFEFLILSPQLETFHSFVHRWKRSMTHPGKKRSRSAARMKPSAPPIEEEMEPIQKRRSIGDQRVENKMSSKTLWNLLIFSGKSRVTRNGWRRFIVRPRGPRTASAPVDEQKHVRAAFGSARVAPKQPKPAVYDRIDYGIVRWFTYLCTILFDDVSLVKQIVQKPCTKHQHTDWLSQFAKTRIFHQDDLEARVVWRCKSENSGRTKNTVIGD